ncbi:MAG: hypothetical protein EHM33_15250 [Chloroflexi bacterium]|nr:MAG: hypothetical protein EHM33_15250 [Chloroflexota bacterium]
MLKDMFTRIENGQNTFISDIVEQFGYTTEQAEKIFNLYRREKIIKLDTGSGRYILSHGAFWDKEVMARALAL